MLKQGHNVRDCILNSLKVDICKNCQVFKKEFQVFSFVTKLCVALFHKWRLKKPSAVCGICSPGMERWAVVTQFPQLVQNV